VALTLLAVLATGACGYPTEEPGLLPRPATESTRPPVPVEPVHIPEPTNPALPVVGEAVWTTAEGLDVQVRLAVHAVRRLENATVLDWSVTPLRAPDLAFGDGVPAFVDLGLTRPAPANVNIFLLDPETEKVYRPLSHNSSRELNRCLCSPLWVAQLGLRIGETRMLQVAYPELPASVRFVDVDLATVAPFTHVPVIPVGEVPTARQPTDLRRPAEREWVLMRPLEFRSPEDENDRRQSVTVNRVVAGPTRTSVEWTLRSVTDQPNFNVLPYGPPVGARLPPDLMVATPSSASGPQLRPAGATGQVVGAQWMTDSLRDQGLLECLCTELGLWASSLRRAGGKATVTTNYPALPGDVSRVDLLLPGAGAAPGLPVTRPTDAAARTGPTVEAEVPRWTYSVSDPQRGWSTADWPTPLPAANQLRHFTSTVDRLVELPR
jgi:hypothetical protein